MPRVHTIKKARAAKRTRTCRGCSQPIQVGDSFYTWEKRFGGPQFCHTACGYPKASWLSNRKTAVIEDAVNELIIDWHPGSLQDLLGCERDKPVPTDVLESGVELATDELLDQLSGIADEAENVGDEYEASADNMPESLQYGYQAEAMRDVAERLREWAEAMRDGDLDGTLELPEVDDLTDWQAWWDEADEALDAKVSELVEAAQELTSDMPEYEG